MNTDELFEKIRENESRYKELLSELCRLDDIYLQRYKSGDATAPEEYEHKYRELYEIKTSLDTEFTELGKELAKLNPMV